MHLLSDSACGTKILKTMNQGGQKLPQEKHKKTGYRGNKKKFIFLW